MFYLIPAVIAWFTAQGLKHLIGMLGRNRRIFGDSQSRLLPSGGMPSAHSATIVAFATYVGLVDGWGSGLFGLSLIFAAIVLSDAMGVRYASGRQGELLNKMAGSMKKPLSPIPVVHGHKPIEVLAGSLIGVVISLIVFFTTI